MSDLISRQAAIDALKNVLVSEELEYALPALKKVPSAQPDSCDGCNWEYAFGYGECHHCKRRFEDMWEEKDDE